MKLIDYIKGLRKGKEAHSIEKEAMSDPFLEEAIEGYDAVKGNHADRLLKMQELISGKTKARTSKNTMLWQSIAACAVLFIVVAGYIAFFQEQSSMGNHYAETDSIALDLYVPEAYIEKRIEENEEISRPLTQKKEQKRIVLIGANIVNLYDILTPAEELDIYVPEVYIEKKKSVKPASVSVTNISNYDQVFDTPLNP